MGRQGWSCAVVILGLGSAAPAWADEVKVTSGVAAGDVEKAEPDAKALVSVRSTGKPVTVAIITDRAVGVGHVAGKVATVTTIHYQDICNSPCSFELDPGLRELVVYGDGVSSAGSKTNLAPGPNAFLVKPGSSALATGGYLAVALGLVAAGVGGTMLAIDSDSSYALPLTLGGVAALGGGIAMWIGGSTSFKPEPAQRATRSPLAVGIRGSF